MRILHTSDWHLGRTFGSVSLADDQAAFVHWLVELCAAEAVDLVVVAGDVYDRAIPGTEAVVLFREALVRLQAGGHTVAVITGNHDGADRVAAYDTLLDHSRVIVRGGYGNIGEVLPLQFRDGPLDLVLLPFLDPQAAPDDLPDTPATATAAADDAFERRMRRTHQSVLHHAVASARPHLAAPRSLAVSHAFVNGGSSSESERHLTVGGTGTVKASLFEGFSYTALGHLHKPQVVGKNRLVRYSGTPLAYSFSETHQKTVTLVDMSPVGVCTIRTIDVPVGRPVLTIRGGIDALLATVPTPQAAGSIVRAYITDSGVVLDAKARLAAVYPHVAEIVLTPLLVGADAGRAVVARATATAAEVADAFWLASTGAPPSAEQQALLHAALTDREVRVG